MQARAGEWWDPVDRIIRSGVVVELDTEAARELLSAIRPGHQAWEVVQRAYQEATS